MNFFSFLTSLIAKFRHGKKNSTTKKPLSVPDSIDEVSYYKSGIRKFNSAEYHGAIDDFSKAISIRGNFHQAFCNRGLTKLKINDNSGAKLDFSKAIEIYPVYARAYLNRGIARKKLGDLEGAKTDFQQAVSIDPQFSSIFTPKSKPGDQGPKPKASETDLTKQQQIISKSQDETTLNGIDNRSANNRPEPPESGNDETGFMKPALIDPDDDEQEFMKPADSEPEEDLLRPYLTVDIKPESEQFESESYTIRQHELKPETDLQETAFAPDGSTVEDEPFDFIKLPNQDPGFEEENESLISQALTLDEPAEDEPAIFISKQGSENEDDDFGAFKSIISEADQEMEELQVRKDSLPQSCEDEAIDEPGLTRTLSAESEVDEEQFLDDRKKYCFSEADEPETAVEKPNSYSETEETVADDLRKHSYTETGNSDDEDMAEYTGIEIIDSDDDDQKELLARERTFEDDDEDISSYKKSKDILSQSDSPEGKTAKRPKTVDEPLQSDFINRKRGTSGGDIIINLPERRDIQKIIAQSVPEDMMSYAREFYSRAKLKYNSEDRQGAIEDLCDAIEFYPKFSQAFCFRGRIKSELNEIQDAITDYSKAIEYNPKNSVAYFNRGMANQKSGSLREALADFTKAILFQPKNPQLYLFRGILKLKMGHNRSALEDWAKAELLGLSQAGELIKKYTPGPKRK